MCCWRLHLLFLFFSLDVPLISYYNEVYLRTKRIRVYFRTTCCFLWNFYILCKTFYRVK